MLHVKIIKIDRCFTKLFEKGKLVSFFETWCILLCALQDGQTFLMIACQLGNYHIIRRLLEETEVDVNAVDNVSTSICDSVLTLIWLKLYSDLLAVWFNDNTLLGHKTVRMLDLQSKGHGFHSWSGCCDLTVVVFFLNA